MGPSAPCTATSRRCIPGRALVHGFLAIAMAGAGDLDVARDLLRRARQEHDLLHWRHPRSINGLLIAFGACAVLAGRKDVAARLLTAAGPPSGGYAPLAAVHLHYATRAGSPQDPEALPDPEDTERLAGLMDDEFLRWSRERSPADASPGALVEPKGRASLR